MLKRPTNVRSTPTAPAAAAPRSAAMCRVAGMAAALVAALAAATLSPVAASAAGPAETRVAAADDITVQTALKFKPFGKKVCIPRPKLCVPHSTISLYVKGDGLTVDKIESDVSDNFGAGNAGWEFCNWRIQWTASDTDNRVYLTSKGPTHNSCDGLVAPIGRKDQSNRRLRPGKICATLYENGKAIKDAIVCTSITP